MVMKITMQDIAKVAGVSPGTVSNALNDRSGVGKDVKKKILEIAEKMGYDKSNRDESKVIRFIIFKKHGYVVSDTPFFSGLIEGIERECRSEGFEVVISHIIHNEHDDKDIKEIVKEKQIAGILLLATEMDKEDFKLFGEFSVPVILVDNYFNDVDLDYVLINNTKGARQAVNFLIKNGHKEIGCLCSSKVTKNFSYRYKGFKTALSEANIEIKDEYDLMLEPTHEGSYRDMKEILKNHKTKLPTAYFALNDIIAFGAMRAMLESGIRVPEEVSIIGFDDMPFCEISSPRLTTIRVSAQSIGKIAVNRLMQKINEYDDDEFKIEINTNLVERESVVKR